MSFMRTRRARPLAPRGHMHVQCFSSFIQKIRSIQQDGRRVARNSTPLRLTSAMRAASLLNTESFSQATLIGLRAANYQGFTAVIHGVLVETLRSIASARV